MSHRGPCIFCARRGGRRAVVRVGTFPNGDAIVRDVCRACEPEAAARGIDLPAARARGADVVLAALRDHGPMTGVELMAATGRDSSVVSRALAALVARGAVERFRPHGKFHHAYLNRIPGDARRQPKPPVCPPLAPARVAPVAPPSPAARIARLTGMPHREVAEALAAGRTEAELLALARRSA